MGADCKVETYHDMKHGWSCRGDLADDKVRRDVESVMKDASGFFKQYLGLNASPNLVLRMLTGDAHVGCWQGRVADAAPAHFLPPLRGWVHVLLRACTTWR